MLANANPHLYALIAGEPSGDTLGSGLIMAIKRRDPLAQFIGIGGPKMIHQGLRSSANMEDLAVMGLTEVLLKLPKILKIKKKQKKKNKKNQKKKKNLKNIKVPKKYLNMI